MHKVGVLFLSCGHSPHQRAPWHRKWSSTERLRPHCCSRRPPMRRRLSVCVGSDFGSNFTESGGGTDRGSRARCLRNSVCPIRHCSDVERGESILRAVELVRTQGALSSKSWPFLPKSCAVRVEISRLFSRRCGAASHLSVLSRHSAWRCAKKSPAVCLTAGGISFAARTAGRVERSGFSTWRRWGAIA